MLWQYFCTNSHFVVFNFIQKKGIQFVFRCVSVSHALYTHSHIVHYFDCGHLQELVPDRASSPAADLLLGQRKPDTPSSSGTIEDFNFESNDQEPLELTVGIKQEQHPCPSPCDALLEALEAPAMDTTRNPADFEVSMCPIHNCTSTTTTNSKLSPIASNANEIVAHLQAPLVSSMPEGPASVPEQLLVQRQQLRLQQEQLPQHKMQLHQQHLQQLQQQQQQLQQHFQHSQHSPRSQIDNRNAQHPQPQSQAQTLQQHNVLSIMSNSRMPAALLTSRDSTHSKLPPLIQIATSSCDNQPCSTTSHANLSFPSDEPLSLVTTKSLPPVLMTNGPALLTSQPTGRRPPPPYTIYSASLPSQTPEHAQHSQERHHSTPTTPTMPQAPPTAQEPPMSQSAPPTPLAKETRVVYPVPIKTEAEVSSPTAKASESTRKIILALTEKLRRKQIQKLEESRVSLSELNDIIHESIDKDSPENTCSATPTGTDISGQVVEAGGAITTPNLQSGWSNAPTSSASAFENWQKSPTQSGSSPEQPTFQQPQVQNSVFYPSESYTGFCPTTPPLPCGGSGPGTGIFSPRTLAQRPAVAPPSSGQTPAHTPSHTPAQSPGPADRNSMVLVISPQGQYGSAPFSTHSLGASNCYSDLKSPDSGFNEGCVSPTDSNTVGITFYCFLLHFNLVDFLV